MNGDGCQSFNPGISQAPEKPQFHHFVEHPAAILYVRDAIVPRRRGTPFQPICQSVPEPSWRAGGNRRFARVGLCGATPGHETLGMRMRTRIPGPIYELARLLALLSASWLTPIERLGPLARALRRLRERERDPSGATEIIMAHLLSDRASPRQASELFRQWQNRLLEMTLQILALRRPGRGWRPLIHLQGVDTLAAALRGGKGAILWISDFVYRPLIVPFALRQAGFAVAHLSRPEHGFSVSPFGVRFLNPLWTAVENRFLSERVVIEGNDARAALATLRERLAGNQLVSITVAETGRRTLAATFLGGRLRLATGPVHLARTSGAPLLPIVAVRKEDGAYTVSIEPPLDVRDSDHPPYSAAIRAYAAMLEGFVRRYPDQWDGWIALGRLAENVPDFVGSFDCASNLRRDLERAGIRAVPAKVAPG